MISSIISQEYTDMLSAQAKNQKSIENFGHMRSNSLGKAIIFIIWSVGYLESKLEKKREQLCSNDGLVD